MTYTDADTAIINRASSYAVYKLFSNTILGEGCWSYVGGRTGSGYGAIYIGDGKQIGAHVVSYEIYNGPIQKGKFVLHSCDNPACVNPRHLFLGDYKTNKQDEINKCRHVYGERVGNSKLIKEDVLEIRVLLKSNKYTLQDIADRYNVTPQNIYRIKHRKTWRHI